MTDDSDSSDWARREWQAEQAARDAARDAALEKQREKQRKARERSARNAQRKLQRLHRTLKDQGEVSDFEDEFAESVTERLDQFGSAFQDLEKGRPGDALSFAQKRVVAAMNRKVKDLKSRPADEEDDDSRARSRPKLRSSFRPKKPKYKPRVRQLDEGFDDTDHEAGPEPYIPERSEPDQSRPPVGKPFLRIVRSSDGSN